MPDPSISRISVAIAGLALGLVSCAGTSGSENRPSSTTAGGTLVVGLASEPDSANVYLARSAASLLLANRVLERLAEERMPYPGSPGGLTPSLAESWSFSDDGLSLAFSLRRGTEWSDGRPVDCGDVAFTFRAQTDADLAWRGASLKRHIDSISCPDPHTAVFRFSRRYPVMVMDANDVHILPATLEEIPFAEWREVDWTSTMSWSGPFLVAAWRSGQEIVLERNDGWDDGGGPALLERIVLRIVPDQSSRATQLAAGELDVVPNLSPEDAARVARSAEVRVLRRPGPSYTYIGWNTLDRSAWRQFRRLREAECARAGQVTCVDDGAAVVALARENPHPLFGDERVRRALTLAIDRETIIDALLLGEAAVPASPILDPLAEHDPELEPWPHDPAAARRLLAEAGFADLNGDETLDLHGRPFSFELLVQAGNALRRDTAVLVQRDLRRIGVAVEIVPVENSAFYDRLARRDFDAWIGSWITSLRVDMTEVLHADAAASGGLNFGSFSDAEADAIAADARELAADGERAERWHAWERRFHILQPYTVLFHANRLTGIRSRVRGTDSILPNDDLAGVERWWLAAPER